MEKKQEHGILLFVSIIIMVVLFMISAAFVSLVSNFYFTSNMGISTSESFWFADAGIEYMIEEIRDNGIYSNYIPESGYGWGQELYSPCLLKRPGEFGFFVAKVKLHPNDWKGRGLVIGQYKGADGLYHTITGTYPSPYGQTSPYPTPNKFRPYLVRNMEDLYGYDPTVGTTSEVKLNRLIIESIGFIQTQPTCPPPPGGIKVKKSLYAIYSVTSEELEAWCELLH